MDEAPVILPALEARVPVTYDELREFLREVVRAWDGPTTMADEIVVGLRTAYAEDGGPPLPTLADVWGRRLESFLDPDRFIVRTSDAGLGPDLDRQLGGGLTPGQVAALVSLSAGGGKTALLHQLTDGFALWSAQEHLRAIEGGWRPQVVPIVLVSEMTTQDLTLRSLARQGGVEGFLLRDPRGPKGRRPLADGLTEGEAALLRAGQVAKGFEDAAQLITTIDRRMPASMADIAEAVRRVRAGWKRKGCDVPAVVVALDPIHRVVDPTVPEVQGLGHALQQTLDLAQREDAIVLLTSDTTKAAASVRQKASAQKNGEQLAHTAEMGFRGSYQLLHLPDVCLGLVTMSVDDENLEPALLHREPPGTLYAEVVNAKARWSKAGDRAAFFLDPAMFRFRSCSRRTLEGEVPLADRILAFVGCNAGCSEHAVRQGVRGGTDAIRGTIHDLMQADHLVDEGSALTGRMFRTAGDNARTTPGQPPGQARGAGVVRGAPPPAPRAEHPSARSSSTSTPDES